MQTVSNPPPPTSTNPMLSLGNNLNNPPLPPPILDFLRFKVAGIQVHGPEGQTYFYQVAEHCVTCVDGGVAPLVIDTHA